MSPAESTTAQRELSRAAFSSFANIITTELGIKMPEAKRSMLQSRIGRRMRELGIASIGEYQKRLFNSPESEQELVYFFDAVTTNKTDFFREPDHFNTLVESALPTLAPRRRPWNAKIWCAGCSTGEEPYTLAMTLADYAQQTERFDFSILCTDICTRVLGAAQKAIYRTDRIAPIPEALRKRYLLRSLDPNRGEVRICPDLRRRVSFARLNFMDEAYPIDETFDVIFFRNVMIYFDRRTQEQVVNKMAATLRPGGYLFVGHSESLTGLDIPFEPLGSSVYRKLA